MSTLVIGEKLERKAIGRKIWYENQPAKIIRINEENELWIEPDGIPVFKAPAHWDAMIILIMKMDYE